MFIVDFEPVQKGPVTSIANDKELTSSSQEEAKEEELQQPFVVVSELVQERPVTSTVDNKPLTELEAEYFQEQLHCTNEGNNLLKQCLEEKK